MKLKKRLAKISQEIKAGVLVRSIGWELTNAYFGASEEDVGRTSMVTHDPDFTVSPGVHTDYLGGFSWHKDDLEVVG